ncbi:aldehyde dehydrogenase family protein [Nocardia sp. NBC_00565]|uniref:aldehyde dehydrogenase family protein n=1 Tax=Nocardia sp. NBC_00565 TaxID=2975993 RepID=UPI002E80AF6C|nr:aldehyde dehydrogenase family protein [Nocardia sp. NBC_00565]WUC06640.1 aldehyde dehydrogenase family protein [Nocardia sp. NBC_00565]
MTSTERWFRNFVDGTFVEPDPGYCFDNIDPATGLVLGLVHEADQTLVDNAVRAARHALDTGWDDTPVRERANALIHEADLPPVFTKFYDSLETRMCENCGTLHPGRG